jgi:hypothetical protein
MDIGVTTELATKMTTELATTLGTRCGQQEQQA